jgi:hypothetical protein
MFKLTAKTISLKNMSGVYGIISESRNGSCDFVARSDEEMVVERLTSTGKNSWSERWNFFIN